MKRHHIIGNLVLSAVLTLSMVPRARAASLQKVEQSTWSIGGLPSYVNMYIYVPDKLAPKPPILVASHHCGGSANSTFNETKSTFVSLADKNGFVIIMPEATGHNCWDVGSAKSLKHDGGGDTHAIAQMVRYTLSKYNGDASRVYAFGTSSGAMMTEALLGVYADMFMAGVSVAGVPCGCWAASYTGDSGANQQWSGPCAGGNVTKTAQEWGDLVRSMNPGYSGHRPRVQLWHGTADTTISFKNLGESIKEWTNVLQLNEMPSATDSAKSGYTHQTWKNACGYMVLETWAQQGAGHDVSWDASSAYAFLGLNQVGGQDPEAVACPGTTGASGASGAMSAAGASGSRGGAGSPSVSVAGSGGTPNGVIAGAGATPPTRGAGSGGAGTGPAVVTGSTGVSAAAGRAGGRATTNASSTAGTSAGAAGVALPSSAGAPASENHSMTSSGGCNCVIGARGVLPIPSFAVFVLGIAWLCVRRKRSTTERRALRALFDQVGRASRARRQQLQR